MVAKCLNLPPVPSTVTSFTLSDAPLSTPAGWWRCPSSSRSSLARDDNDDSDVHCCSCCRVVVVLVVMLVVVMLLSVVLSRCCCHRCRCHRRTTNAQRPTPSPRPPPLLLPSQSHSLQLSPLPSPRCFHRPRQHGYRPRHCIDGANSLNAAIAGCRHRHGHRCRHCRRRCIHFAAAIAVTITAASKQPNFLVCCKKYRGNSKTTNPSKLPVSKKTAQSDVTLKHSESLR